MTGPPLLHLRVKHIGNQSMLIFLQDDPNSDAHHIFATSPPYDDQGAMYYAVAVVCIYGLSILLMIASVIKKDKSDHGVSKYMSDMDKIRRAEKREAKAQTHLILQKVRRLSRFGRTGASTSSLTGNDEQTKPLDGALEEPKPAKDLPRDGETVHEEEYTSLLLHTSVASSFDSLNSSPAVESPDAASGKTSPWSNLLLQGSDDQFCQEGAEALYYTVEEPHEVDPKRSSQRYAHEEKAIFVSELHPVIEEDDLV